MKRMLDTQLLLWAAVDSDRLPAEVRDMLRDSGVHPVFSAASIWEVAIKSALGREDFSFAPSLLRRGLLENGYSELPVTGRHAAAVARLPPIHGDPFDRIILAQAEVEEMALFTTDAALKRYGGPVRLVEPSA